MELEKKLLLGLEDDLTVPVPTPGPAPSVVNEKLKVALEDLDVSERVRPYIHSILNHYYEHQIWAPIQTIGLGDANGQSMSTFVAAVMAASFDELDLPVTNDGCWCEIYQTFVELLKPRRSYKETPKRTW